MQEHELNRPKKYRNQMSIPIKNRNIYIGECRVLRDTKLMNKKDTFSYINSKQQQRGVAEKGRGQR